VTNTIDKINHDLPKIEGLVPLGPNSIINILVYCKLEPPRALTIMVLYNINLPTPTLVESYQLV